MAAAAALKERGVIAEGAAGFSLGEIPALASSGLLSAQSAFDFVNFRAEVMHQCAASTQGSMMAVLGLFDDLVERLCEKIDGAWPVNYNTATQTVVAYKLEAEAALKEAISAAKGKALPLSVAGAFHSPLMTPAAEKLAEKLAGMKFAKPAIPLYSNVTARPYGANEARELLSRQVNSPVRWVQKKENMVADGYSTFIEVGPGKTLTGMIKKINKDVRVFNVFDEETLENCVASV
jgi:[acyl-carrier-protein] S-malonyltransferase